MFRPVPRIVPSALAPACLIATLLLSACADRPVLAPDSVPSTGAKPALAAPPSSLMTPHGY